jgi:cyclohexyl-isocyanide hydratase
VASRGERATYVTGVCTGALVRGAAELLDGYRATSHWSVRDLLPLFGSGARRTRRHAPGPTFA